MTLDDIYNIKGLDDKEIDRETRIQIASHRVIAYNGIALFIVDTLCAQFGGQPTG